MAAPGRPRSRRRLPRSALALRWIGVAVLLAIAVAYVQPLRAYRAAQADVAARSAEVERLEDANVALEAQIEQAAADAFVEREARKLGLVRPGERLFIVTGIDAWKRDRRAVAKSALR